MTFERWNDGARLSVIKAQEVRERGDELALTERHLLQGILETRCDAADVLMALGFDRLADQSEAPTGAIALAEEGSADSLQHPSNLQVLTAVAESARVDAIRRRSPSVTSCQLAITLLDRLISAEPDAAARNSAARLAGELRAAGLDLAATRDALVDHLDAALTGPSSP